MINNVERAVEHARLKGVIISIRHPIGEPVNVSAAHNGVDGEVKRAERVITAENYIINGNAELVLAIESCMEEVLHNELAERSRK